MSQLDVIEAKREVYIELENIEVISELDKFVCCQCFAVSLT
jgi:hypothetical protein